VVVAENILEKKGSRDKIDIIMKLEGKIENTIPQNPTDFLKRINTKKNHEEKLRKLEGSGNCLRKRWKLLLTSLRGRTKKPTEMKVRAEKMYLGTRAMRRLVMKRRKMDLNPLVPMLLGPRNPKILQIVKMNLRKEN